MLARATKIRHPLGALIDLPRLVPAFSSKGFPFLVSGHADGAVERLRNRKSRRIRKREGRQKISETTLALESVGPYIKDSMLVSAYDLHHRHFRKPERFFEGKELVFLDSGGYELSPGFDQTEPVHWGTPNESFKLEDYAAVLGTLSRGLPFVISNYDWGTRGKPIDTQVLSAQKLFSKFPHHMTDFIIKPTRGERYVDVAEVAAHVKKFRGFSILGVTEKELGKDLIAQLESLAKLRLALDREDVRIPIHVWGGLDPLLTPLYFFAGAEIFDGISWLRYAYHDGVAVYRDSHSILISTIESPRDQAKTVVLNSNLSYLRTLSTSFHDFVLQRAQSFKMFGSRAGVLEAAFRALVTRVPEVEGGK